MRVIPTLAFTIIGTNFAPNIHQHGFCNFAGGISDLTDNSERIEVSDKGEVVHVHCVFRFQPAAIQQHILNAVYQCLPEPDKLVEFIQFF